MRNQNTPICHKSFLALSFFGQLIAPLQVPDNRIMALVLWNNAADVATSKVLVIRNKEPPEQRPSCFRCRDLLLYLSRIRLYLEAFQGSYRF
jgi:hypothetical protein